MSDRTLLLRARSAALADVADCLRDAKGDLQKVLQLLIQRALRLHSQAEVEDYRARRGAPVELLEEGRCDEE